MGPDPIAKYRFRCSITGMIGRPSVLIFALLLLIALIGVAYALGYVSGRLLI